MNKIISILLVGLLGFLGCSDNDDGTSAIIVQAVLSYDDVLGYSAFAVVMDQEGDLSSDAMVFANGMPMNLGFLNPEIPAEDLEANLLNDAMDQTGKGVSSEGYLPVYFLDYLDIDEFDTVHFEAIGWGGYILYSDYVEVPEQLDITQPSDGDTVSAKDPLVVRWTGGAACSQSEVALYSSFLDDIIYNGECTGEREYTFDGSLVQDWGAVIVASWEPSIDVETQTNVSGVWMYQEELSLISVGPGTAKVTSSQQQTEGQNRVANSKASSNCSDQCKRYMIMIKYFTAKYNRDCVTPSGNSPTAVCRRIRWNVAQCAIRYARDKCSCG